MITVSSCCAVGEVFGCVCVRRLSFFSCIESVLHFKILFLFSDSTNVSDRDRDIVGEGEKDRDRDSET